MTILDLIRQLRIMEGQLGSYAEVTVRVSSEELGVNTAEILAMTPGKMEEYGYMEGCRPQEADTLFIDVEV